MLLGTFRNGRNVTAAFQQQPLRFIFVVPLARAHTNQGPLAFEFLSVQEKVQFALAKRAQWIIARNFVSAGVPEHHCARAITAFGNCAFEPAILDWMIFDLHGEPAIAPVCRKTFGNSPGFENTVHLKPEIVMKASRVVLLHDEHRCAIRSGPRSIAGGFGGAPEVALGFIFLEAQAAFLR
jgi:hypothetical protein